MKCVKSILSTVLFLYLVGTIQAQHASTIHDFIILPSGSKEFGKIETKFDLLDYRSIQFTNSSGISKEFFPQDIQGFGFANGRVFLSQTEPKNGTTVFYQLLFQGKLSLLSRQGLFLWTMGKKSFCYPKLTKKSSPTREPYRFQKSILISRC